MARNNGLPGGVTLGSVPPGVDPYKWTDEQNKKNQVGAYGVKPLPGGKLPNFTGTPGMPNLPAPETSPLANALSPENLAGVEGIAANWRAKQTPGNYMATQYTEAGPSAPSAAAAPGAATESAGGGSAPSAYAQAVSSKLSKGEEDRAALKKQLDATLGQVDSRISQDQSSLDQIMSQMDPSNAANKEIYRLTGLDRGIYGQMSDDTSRQFAQGQQNLSDALAAHGLGASASGAAQRGMAGLDTAKSEKLVGLQNQIQQNRINTVMGQLDAKSKLLSSQLEQGRGYRTQLQNAGTAGLAENSNSGLDYSKAAGIPANIDIDQQKVNLAKLLSESPGFLDYLKAAGGSALGGAASGLGGGIGSALGKGVGSLFNGLGQNGGGLETTPGYDPYASPDELDDYSWQYPGEGYDDEDV